MKIRTLKSLLNSRKLLACKSPHIAVGLVALLSTAGLKAALVHNYELNGSYADTEPGGISLDPGGPLGAGTLGATGYSFGANQGLSLSNALITTGTYSILIDFSISNVVGYRKLIDFKNFATDGGVYDVTGKYQLYGSPAGGAESSSIVFQDNQLVRMVVTRDTTSQQFTGYIDGVQVDTFSDTVQLGVFSGPNGIIQFFNSNLGDTSESSAGLVDKIQIYDTALAASEVLVLGVAGVPEPSTFLLCSLGLAALIGTRIRTHAK